MILWQADLMRMIGIICWKRQCRGVLPGHSRNALTEIIEWQFLKIPEEILVVEEDQKLSESIDASNEDITEHQEIVSDTEEEVTISKEENKEVTDVAKEHQDSKAKLKFRPYRGKIKPAKVDHMTESLEETEMKLFYSQVDLELVKPTGSLIMPASCASLLKALEWSPPGNKEVTLDEMGNIVAVVKLDPEKLPTRQGHVKYHVIDPVLDIKSHEAIPKANLKSKHRIYSSLTPLPPPLIEEMELSRGVVVREGGQVKKGPGLKV
ncbi:hypothetical protein Btru_068265 [Bulinus truncatus]|nr:hypothetical protein Btru_068265 [Bulinus truncatus]